MNRQKVAKELLKTARELVSATVSGIVDNFYDMWEDVQNKLDARTFSHDEYKEFLKDFSKAFKGTKELKQWGNSFNDAVGELVVESQQQDLEEETDIKASVLESDFKAMKKVLNDHDVYNRIMRPNKYISRMREYQHSNKGYLNVIPKWLEPIMVEARLGITEGIEGVFFSVGGRGDSWGSDISPTFEDVVDLINWAKSNKAKLQKLKTASSKVASSKTAALQSRKRLYRDLVEMKQEGIAVAKIPSDFKQLPNEVYGRKAMIYIDWKSMADRKAGERELYIRGYDKVNRAYSPSEPKSEVQVSYFKGWHWDE